MWFWIAVDVAIAVALFNWIVKPWIIDWAERRDRRRLGLPEPKPVEPLRPPPPEAMATAWRTRRLLALNGRNNRGR